MDAHMKVVLWWCTVVFGNFSVRFQALGVPSSCVCFLTCSGTLHSTIKREKCPKEAHCVCDVSWVSFVWFVGSLSFVVRGAQTSFLSLQFLLWMTETDGDQTHKRQGYMLGQELSAGDVKTDIPAGLHAKRLRAKLVGVICFVRWRRPDVGMQRITVNE